MDSGDIDEAKRLITRAFTIEPENDEVLKAKAQIIDAIGEEVEGETITERKTRIATGLEAAKKDLAVCAHPSCAPTFFRSFSVCMHFVSVHVCSCVCMCAFVRVLLPVCTCVRA